jgi:hypothetical protein
MRQDILTNDDGSFKTANGDFVIGVADESHIQDIVSADKNHYKQNPLIGVGIVKKLNSHISQGIVRDIKLNIAMDGYSGANVSYDDEKNIKIDIND